jgi:hypothetical protein
MSVQEMKIQIYQLVDHTDDESALEQLLQQAKNILADQSETERDILDDLTPEQLAGLERARQEGHEGKYTKIAEFKQEVSQWLRNVS